MRDFIIRFHSIGSFYRSGMSSAFLIIIFLAGAIMEEPLQWIFSGDKSHVPWGLFSIVIVLLFAVFYGIIHMYSLHVLAQYKSDIEYQERTITDALEKLTKLDADYLATLGRFARNTDSKDLNFTEVFICSSSKIVATIGAFGDVVNSHHNRESSAMKRINFETTLITKSLIDSMLTIAAWSNRENRRPHSLDLRNQYPDIYSKTEAAKIMEERGRNTIIIPNTSNPITNYSQLYDGQRYRIRSTVLHPVMSSENQPLGVIVLHCDEADFFKLDDVRYWRELMEIFSTPIAIELEKIATYNLVIKRKNIGYKNTLKEYKPF